MKSEKVDNKDLEQSYSDDLSWRYQGSHFKHTDFMLIDLLTITLAYWCTFVLKLCRDGVLSITFYIRIWLVAVSSFVVLVFFWQIYSGILRRGNLRECYKILQLNADIYIAISLALMFTQNTVAFSREFTIEFVAFDVFFMNAFHFLWKMHLRRKLANSSNKRNLYIATTREYVESIVKMFLKNEDSSEFRLKGIILLDQPTKTNERILDYPVVAGIDDAVECVERHRITDVLIHAKNVDADSFVNRMTCIGVNTYETLVFLGSGSFKQVFEQLNGFNVLATKDEPPKYGTLFVKRLFDIIGSAFALILLLPIFVIIAYKIKKEDGGKVFYASKRIGYRGKIINVHKFRSMKPDADSLENVLTPEQLEEYKKEFKLDDDPRVTAIGRKLRSTSLDEIPQFWDVLIGNLSLVGPRPVSLEETKFYKEKRRLFLSVKPGITGYWQANGRNNITYESGQRQNMELYYVENHSLWMDIRILFRTVGAVLKKDGAK